MKNNANMTILEDILMPLKKIGINYFVYAQIYPDNTGFFIASDKKFEKFYFDKQFPIMGTSQKEGIHTWSSLMPKEAIELAEDLFNHTNGIVFIRKQKNYIEQIEFASSCNKSISIDFYINNMPLIDKFLLHFKYIAKDLLSITQLKKIYIPHQMRIVQPLFENNFPHIPMKHFLIEYNGAHVELKPKELQVLKLYCMGYSAKKIAELMKLSARTIEDKINLIKQKLRVSSKSELQEILYGNFFSCRINQAESE